MEELSAAYAAAPYPDLVHSQAHPARLAAMAALFGLTPADVATCRVLEVGCGPGGNLRAIAQDLLAAALLGLDLAPGHVEQGRRAIAAEGLSNLELRQADLLEVDLGSQRFDYIIAHGFFSWVPDPVKERLLALCRDHLSEQGLAFISYNVYPGWSYQEAVATLLRMENSTEQPSRAAFDAGLGLLRDLGAYGGQPHMALLREEIGLLERQPFEVTRHDQLGPVNDPCFVLQFVDWAAEFGLAYVGDMGSEPSLPGMIPPPLARRLAEASKGRLAAEQYLDFLGRQRIRRRRCAPCQAGAAHREPAGAGRFPAGMLRQRLRRSFPGPLQSGGPRPTGPGFHRASPGPTDWGCAGATSPPWLIGNPG